MQKILSHISTDAIIESISDGVFTVDDSRRITSFNRAAEQITGISRKEAIGRFCFEVFRADLCENDCALRKTLDTGVPTTNKPAFIINADKRRIPISVSTALLRDASGKIVGGAETFRDLSVVEELRSELRKKFRIGDILSESPAMRHVLELIPPAAKSESAVLITGETGTGKELVARALHTHSPRRRGPFIPINCGALPDSLLESELFGYVKGAFTGADADKPGRFALASGGTLFLDEIGDISPALQVRLLRVLEEKTFEPLGGTRSTRADVRVLFATHRNLDEAVAKGTFRKDLYYRIHVLHIDLPPLRDRIEDIPLLTDHFVHHFNASHGKSIRGLSPEVTAVLLAHDYPGNVRELKNIVEHAFVICSGDIILPEHLPKSFLPNTATAESTTRLKNSLRVMEADTIRKALGNNHGNRLAAARELGIHKSTFFRKAKRLGIALPEEDGRFRRK